MPCNDSWKDQTHQATGGELKKQASHDGAKQLSNPVQDTTEKGNVTANKGTKGDGRVNMAAGDVGADWNSHEQCEGVSYSGSNEAGRGIGCIVGQLAKGHA